MKELSQKSILNPRKVTFKSMFFPNQDGPDPVKCLTELATSSAEGCRKELREYQALFLKKEGLIHCGGGGELWEEFELVSASQGEKNEE